MSFSDFLNTVPNMLAGKGLKELGQIIISARRNKRPFVFGMGAHVIKVGLSPIIIHLMKQGIITAIAQNGACLIHDFELAAVGRTSEDVGASIGDGTFGMAKETADFLNNCAQHAYKEDIGLGEAVGMAIEREGLPYKELSIIYNAYCLNIPVTIHVAIGTDIIHMHPSADGAAIGASSYNDFKLFTSIIAGLDQGVYVNFGSAVILPEVFLKAITIARNLGYPLDNITTANFDFIRQYRPHTNVVSRPTLKGGKGFNFTGHHEIMLPMLAAILIEGLSKTSGT